MRKRLSTIDPADLYILLSVIGAGLVILCLFLSHGELWNCYFFHNINDTGNDFIHSIQYVWLRTPYEQFSVLYPPFANLLFYGLFRFVPQSVYDGFGYDFWEDVNLVSTEYDPRLWQPTLMLYLAFCIVSVLILYILAERMLRGTRHPRAAALCAVSCYGVVYAIERGNVILTAVTLTLVFLQFYNHPKVWVREIAILCLAMAIGIKIYPALFLILLIRDRNYGGLIRGVVYTVAMNVGAVLCFKDGFHGARMWIAHLFQPLYGIIMGDQSFTLENVAQTLGLSSAALLIVIVSVAVIAGVLFVIAVCWQPQEWQAILVISVVMIAAANIKTATTGPYIYCYLLVPFIALLKAENQFSWINTISQVLMMALIVNLPLFNYGSFDRSSYERAVMAALAVWCVILLVRGVRIRHKVRTA